MQFNEYQARTDETAIYPCGTTIEALSYLGLGLGEAGEIQGKLKKILRDSGGAVSLAHKDAIAAELGDLLWYVAQLATTIDYSLEEIAHGNLLKLAKRKEAGTLQGSGDNR